MASKRTKLQEDTHFHVLRLLQENPEMSQRELAEAVGVSVGGMRTFLRPKASLGRQR
jgi:DNA-binding Lrp family transcriptional regulator